MTPVLKYLVTTIVPLTFKSGMYYGIFRLRSINATVMKCIIIAAAPILVSIIPLPSFLQTIVGIGAAIFLCSYYTESELYPDGIFIPIGVELCSLTVMWLVVIPLIS